MKSITEDWPHIQKHRKCCIDKSKALKWQDEEYKLKVRYYAQKNTSSSSQMITPVAVVSHEEVELERINMN